MKKFSGQDCTALEWNYVARATRRRRRILQNRILSCRKYCVMSKNEKLNALYEKFSVLSSTP
ncbi:MAG TPA: hypothetical protein DF667_02335 [Roseburia sp.]|nr:hypothetical protein [Roseburia sp.]